VLILFENKYVYEEGPELCELCASDSAYYVLESDDDEIGKYHCVNCDSEYRFIGTEYRDTGDLVILKGEKRDWPKHLKKALTFPFEAYINEFQERRPFKQNDAVIVRGIEFEDDQYGLIASIILLNKKRAGRYSIPITDLRAKDEQSKNYMELHDYSVWVANF